MFAPMNARQQFQQPPMQQFMPQQMPQPFGGFGGGFSGGFGGYGSQQPMQQPFGGFRPQPQPPQFGGFGGGMMRPMPMRPQPMPFFGAPMGGGMGGGMMNQQRMGSASSLRQALQGPLGQMLGSPSPQAPEQAPSTASEDQAGQAEPDRTATMAQSTGAPPGGPLPPRMPMPMPVRGGPVMPRFPLQRRMPMPMPMRQPMRPTLRGLGSMGMPMMQFNRGGFNPFMSQRFMPRGFF